MKNSFVVAALAAFLAVEGTPAFAEEAQAATGIENQTAPAISVMRAARKKISEDLAVTGSFTAGANVRVPALVEGLAVVEILAEEGDEVKEGQVLARLMSDDVDLQLAQHEASLARNAAAIEQAKVQIEQAKISKDQALANWTRTNTLKKKGVSTGEQLDQRTTDHELAEAQLHAAELALTTAQADSKMLEAQGQELALRKSRTEIKAPVDGYISSRLVEYGMVSSVQGNPLFTIVAKNVLKLVAEVPEADLGKVSKGLKAKVSINGRPDTFEGEVALISPEVDSTTRMGRVHIRLAEGTRVPIGAFGRATIALAADEGLALPLTAVTFGKDGPTIQIVKDGKVEVRAIETGLVSSTEIEVTQGVAPGETFVVQAGSFVRAGDTVTPVVQQNSN